jgi:hypothetical protein
MRLDKHQARAKRRAKTMRLQRWNKILFRRSKHVLEDAR